MVLLWHLGETYLSLRCASWCTLVIRDNSLVIYRVVLMEGADCPGGGHNGGFGCTGVHLPSLHVRGWPALSNLATIEGLCVLGPV